MQRLLKAVYLTLLLCFANISFANIETPEPIQKNLWGKWHKNNPNSTETLRYRAWHEFLKLYLKKRPNGERVINYQAVPKKQQRNLGSYLAHQARVPIRNYNKKQQLAYWINLYNALTVDTILKHYPVESPRDIHLNNLVQLAGPWDKNLLRVQGSRVSLNDIKNRIIRPIWPDPRILYLLNNGSLGAPGLQAVPITAANIDYYLDKAASEYINNPHGIRVTPQSELRASYFYAWYKNDFGGSDVAVIKHLKRYAKPKLKQKLANINKISEYYYNWDLNASS